MAKYPVKIMLDHQHRPFFPFITPDVIVVNESEDTLMDLINDRYTKEEVDEIIRSLGTLQRICGTVSTVSDLPVTAENGDTYIVLNASGNNSEYMWINNGWEELGPFIDLSNYYTKSDTDNIINAKAATLTLNYESADAANLQAAKDYTDLKTSSIPTPDLSNYYTKSETYNKTEIDNKDTNTLSAAKNYTDTQIAGIQPTVATDLLHYKGHVVNEAALPSLGQPSGTATQPNWSGTLARFKSTWNYFAPSAALITAMHNDTNMHNRIQGYTYYILSCTSYDNATTSSGNSNQRICIAYNNADQVKIKVVYNTGDNMPSILFSIDASQNEPVYVYTTHIHESSPYWTNSTTGINQDIDMLVTTPMVLLGGPIYYGVGSRYFYFSTSLKYTANASDVIGLVDEDLTGASITNRGIQNYTKYKSITISDEDNYTWSDGMIMFTTTVADQFNLQFNTTTTELNDTYTVGTNYDIYRRNENTQWEVWSKAPSNLSDFQDDMEHRTVTDVEKSAWNNKSNFSGSYNDLSNKPTIPNYSAGRGISILNGVISNTLPRVYYGNTIPSNNLGNVGDIYFYFGGAI